MKFEVSSIDLLKTIQIANNAIVSNPILPILEDLLFDINNNVLTIRSTNMESTIVTKVDVMSDENFSVAVPARLLSDTLKGLPEQPVTIKVDESSYAVELTSSYGKYKLSGDQPEDFPELPEKEETKTFEIKTALLKKAIANTLFATSNDELRVAMTGMLMEVNENNVTFVSTDAHKLVKYVVQEIASSEATTFIVPKNSLNLLLKTLDHSDITTVSYNRNNAFFEFGESELITRLIDAKYPDYNAVIPVDNANTLSISRREFQGALKRMALYANKTTHQAVLKLSDDSLTLSAQDLDFYNEAQEQQACSYDGEAMTIGLNSKFLIDMLNVISSDDVHLELAAPDRAVILRPSESETFEDLLMLIMPVMTS